MDSLWTAFEMLGMMQAIKEAEEAQKIIKAAMEEKAEKDKKSDQAIGADLV